MYRHFRVPTGRLVLKFELYRYRFRLHTRRNNIKIETVAASDITEDLNGRKQQNPQENHQFETLPIPRREFR